MNGLEQFDKCQGLDPTRLRMRETMPEPAEFEGKVIKVRKPVEEPVAFLVGGYFSADKVVEVVESEIFTKCWMVTAEGGVFQAWKSLVDGQVYI